MSTLKTNNIQHVDRSDPSIIINTDGSVNIAGTMTYEDVTNVDAVGIITGRNNIDAQKQVHVGTGVSIKSGGINVTAGISTFVDASVRHVTGVGATFSTIRIGKTGGQGKGLEIYQASDAALRIQNSTTGTGSNDGILFEANQSNALLLNYESGYLTFGTAGTERVRILANGLVGVGITNPDRQFEVNANSSNTFIRIKSSDSGNAGIEFGDQSDTVQGAIFQNSSDNSLRFNGYNNSERARIDSSGRILIGHSTGNGYAQLSVSGNTAGASGAGMLFLRRGLDRATIGGNVGADLGEILIGDLDGNVYASIQGKTDAATGSSDYPGRLIFATTSDGGSSPTERLRISSTGVLTSNRSSTTAYSTSATTNDSSFVIINGGAAGHSTIQLQSVSSGSAQTGQATVSAFNESAGSKNTALTFATRQNSDAAVVERMRIDSSGRLLLAATSGTARLHIKGNGGDGIKIENSGGTNAATIDLKNTLSSYVQEYRIAVAGSDGAYGTAKSLFVRDQTSGANRFEVQAGGDVKVSTGNLLIGTAGKGVNFSAYATSGNPSSNLLDDYEEGIATFTLHINGGAWSGASYSYNTAPYVKVGRMVYCAVSMFATNLDGTTGYMDIDGLPFTDGGAGGYREPTFVAANHALGTNPSVLYGAVIGSTTKIRLRKAGSADLDGADVGGSFWFHGSFVYMANA